MSEMPVIFPIFPVSKSHPQNYFVTKGRRAKALDLLTSVVSIL
jgi:hypothetical protein